MQGAKSSRGGRLDCALLTMISGNRPGGMSSAQEVKRGETEPRPGGTGRAESGVWTPGELAHETPLEESMPLWELVGLAADSAEETVDEDCLRFPSDIVIVGCYRVKNTGNVQGFVVFFADVGEAGPPVPTM